MPYSGPRLRSPDGHANEIGPRAAARRAQLGLKQDELCARIAYVTGGQWSPGWQDISRIENGARLVTDIEIKVLAGVLECSAAWLLLGEDVVADRKWLDINETATAGTPQV